MKKADVLIIGSEGAGARAAIQAHDRGAKVLIVTKGRMARSGATIRKLGFCLGPLFRTLPSSYHFILMMNLRWEIREEGGGICESNPEEAKKE